MDNIKTFKVNSKVDIKKSNIYAGEYELIDSNSILYIDSELPIELEMVFTSTLKITIRFINIKNETGEKKLQVDVDTEENIIEYKCINFDNHLGTGTSKPIEIGTVGGKKLFIHFWIYVMGNNSVTRKMEYSIWKER